MSTNFVNHVTPKGAYAVINLNMRMSSKVPQLMKNIKYIMKLTVKVNSSFIYLNVSNVNYNILENPNGNSTSALIIIAHTKNPEMKKLLTVEKHFLLPNHNSERDATYTIIEKIENIERDDAKKVLEKRENTWMTHLQTIYPNGLNSRITNPLSKC